MNYRSDQITVLLNRIEEGEKNQVEVLFPLVYEHLREVAHQQLRSERRSHTLETTALVHEAYLKLVDQDKANFENRAHFLAIAALSMRRILISYARKKNADKRGGKDRPVTFKDGMAGEETTVHELIDLDDALSRLEEMDEMQAKIVQYRFFGGLTYKEIAKVTGKSEDAVRYDWRVARAWLQKEIGEIPG